MNLKNLAMTMCALGWLLTTGCPSEEGDGGGGSGGGGGGGNKDLTPEQALAGGCDMTGGEGTECTGIEEYTACANDQCGMDDCLSGPCAAYLTCVTNADDACTAVDGECTPTSECNTCLQDAGLCTVNMKCTDLISCGEKVEGGPCDRVDACCLSLDSFQKMACDLQASPVKTGGDETCQQLLDGYGCP
jgi:hypothetical protein